MTSYDDWKTRSDGDEPTWGHRGPAHVTVECIACHREFWVEADERPPYRCPICVGEPWKATTARSTRVQTHNRKKTA